MIPLLLAATALQIKVGARPLVPGEPLRIVVVSSQALAKVSGDFLGRALVFSPRGAATTSFAAWGVAALDDRSGPALISIDAVGVDGAKVHAERRVIVQPKRFPTQRLNVAPNYAEPPPEVADRISRERALTDSIYARRTASAEVDEPFLQPVAGTPTSIFGARRIFNGKPRDPHPGLDLQAAVGTSVHCSGKGVVVLAQELYFSGNTVIVDHGAGLFTIYAHLSRIDVAPGASASRGTQLGLSGATGRVTGPHLHWGARLGSVPFDPRALTDPGLFP